MPISDTVGTYSGQTALGYAGMIAEAQMIKDVASKAVTTAVVPFGLAVGRDGTSPNTVKLGGMALRASPLQTKLAPTISMQSVKWQGFCAKAQSGSLLMAP